MFSGFCVDVNKKCWAFEMIEMNYILYVVL